MLHERFIRTKIRNIVVARLPSLPIASWLPMLSETSLPLPFSLAALNVACNDLRLPIDLLAVLRAKEDLAFDDFDEVDFGTS